MRTFRAQVPIVLDLEVLAAGPDEPAVLVDAIKRRFAGVADPFSGCQVFFGTGYTESYMKARTRNATLVFGREVTITVDDAPPHFPPRQAPSG
jgi:hypothetical protein